MQQRRLARIGAPRVGAERLLLLAWVALFCAVVAELFASRQQPACSAPSQSGEHQPAAAGAPGSGYAEASSPTAASPTAASPGRSSEGEGPSWEQVAELLERPSQLYGRQVKGGMPAEWPKLLSHMTNKNAGLHGVPEFMSQAVFRWFAAAYTFNASAGQSNYGLQSPVPPCHFYADHRYRILYVRTSKTASTSISRTLGMKENPMVCKWSKDACWAMCRGKPVCLSYVWDAEELQQIWREYTVFSFVRNPWARAISSWLHIHKLGLKPECQDPFPRFASAPSAYGAKCVGRPACCLQRFGWILEHIEPQARCLFDERGLPAVDFVGRVEHIDDDMQALLKLVNSRRPMGTQALAVRSMPRLMVADADLARKEERRQRYAELYLGSSALEDVRSYFHEDFERLRFPTALPWLQQSGDGATASSNRTAAAVGGDSGGPGAGDAAAAAAVGSAVDDRGLLEGGEGVAPSKLQ